jgi:hypothetical protein
MSRKSIIILIYKRHKILDHVIKLYKTLSITRSIITWKYLYKYVKFS